MATAVSVEGSTFTLLIDNYDSYTFNLFQYLAEVNGRPPCVIRNDQLTWEALQAVLPHFHNVVISPGPGVPSNSADFGVCEQLLREAELPVLGVCLGHQGLAHVSGAEVVRAPRVAHGVVSQVQHTNDPLFQGVPLSFKVVRYHSWTVSDAPAFGQHLECIARSVDDGLVMAIRHKARPMWGVQFHPESVCTEHGKTILRNFRDLSRRHRAHVPAAGAPPLSTPTYLVPPSRPIQEQAFPYRLRWRRLATDAPSHEVFCKLFADSPKCFWLDSSRTDSQACRYSYMGSCDGPHAFYTSYSLAQREVTTWKRRGGQVQQRAYRLAADQSFFDVVDRKLAKRKCPIDKDLPFDFVGGFVGYFGYEMKHEAGAFPDLPSTAQADAPDAAFVFADRVVAFDHVARSVYVMCLGKEARGTGEEGGAEERASREWFAQVEQSLASDPSAATSPRHTSPSVQDNAEQQPPVPFALQRPYEQYKDDIRACLEEIGRGDSYELCLTNKITTPLRPDPLGLYLRLRESNPAPFASFLRLEEDLHILSSSPEKFLSVDNARTVECKPIKGTTPRGRTPEEDEALKAHLQSNPKDFSENLMIVDLIRNDMGRVCEINSVHVPYLMHVESYATVHQLVSTVRGQLRPGLSALDSIRHSFPPGSMTGAPKLRSMDILNRLEKAPRGVYSGVLGYLSAAGSASFNVVIRTAVIGPQGTSIGCGGAVVADSDVEGEFDEMLLKAHRLITTICDAAGHRKDGLAIAGVPPEKLLSPPPAPAPEPPFSGAAAFLRCLSPRGMDLGVGRIRSFLASLGEPQNQVRTIHVTGTNGKGSVCAFLTAIWRYVGGAAATATTTGEKPLKVGRFTSPHLVDWRESITVDERMISESDFDAVLHTISAQMKHTAIPLTQFEALTAAAYLHFHQQRVDVAIIEVGLGGANDATNVIDRPLAAVLTSISLDHVEILGNSVEAIAREKSGIIKRGRPTIVSALIPPPALAVIEETARALGSPLHLVRPATWDTPRQPDRDAEEDAALFVDEAGRAYRYRLRLNGEHQLTNSALAIATVRLLCDEDADGQPAWHAPVDEERLARGVGRVRWPGRVQWLCHGNRRILLDGSHNAEGGAQLRRYVDHAVRRLRAAEEERAALLPVKRRLRVHWVVGMLGHKDHSAYLRSILVPPHHHHHHQQQQQQQHGGGHDVSEAISFVEVRPNVDWLKPFPPAQLQELAREVVAMAQREGTRLDLGGMQVVPSLDHVLGQIDAREATGEAVLNVVVACGSLHLCGNVLAAAPPFDLLETLRWEPPGTFVLLEHHLERLARALLHFDFCPDPEAAALLVARVRDQLHAIVAREKWAEQQQQQQPSVRRVRVLVGADERIEVQSVEIDSSPIVTDLAFLRGLSPTTSSTTSSTTTSTSTTTTTISTFAPRTTAVKVRAARAPVLRDDPFLRWKTTHREAYARALRDVRSAEAAAHATVVADDVVLYNQWGQVTETTIANIAIVRPRKMMPTRRTNPSEEEEMEVVTPPVACGLLEGTMRRALVAGGWMVEAPITLEDLGSAQEILLFNSVRGVYRAQLLPPP